MKLCGRVYLSFQCPGLLPQMGPAATSRWRRHGGVEGQCDKTMFRDVMLAVQGGSGSSYVLLRHRTGSQDVAVLSPPKVVPTFRARDLARDHTGSSSVSASEANQWP